jgi:hypothetical protein
MSNQPIKVIVTEDHIKVGIERDGKSCPIALALKDILGHDRFIAVGIVNATIGPTVNYKANYKLSPNLSEFIRNFDDGISVDPIEGTLTPI